MPFEPGSKRGIAFIGGQNLSFAAKAAFGYNYPNYDPPALARRVTESREWDLVGVSFYTGVPARTNRGIDKTDWIPIDRALYDSCLDPHDYRPRFEG